MNIHRFQATSSRAERIDKVVVDYMDRIGASASRSTIQQWIEHGHVKINDAACKASTMVPRGAWITVEPEAPPPSTATPDATIRIHVVFEDEHILVIDKPAGIVVHPARGHWSGTLVNGLIAHPSFHVEEMLNPMDRLRPGIVHRLDKETSGLLVVAKTNIAKEKLKEQFAAHSIAREYIAIVAGEAKNQTYDTLHGRHPTDRIRFSTHVQSGKRAITHVSVISTFSGATLVTCRLETGRTHQIRVHLSECGKTPILADKLYGKTPKDPKLHAIANQLGRQALHAWLLGIIHPMTGQFMQWQSELPQDLSTAIESLRELTKPSI